MREMWVRGIFFKQVLDYVKRDRGKTSYELLNRDVNKYRVEEKYDFGDFCQLLEKVNLIAIECDGSYISRMARDTMTEEATWKSQFRRLDPKGVFMTMKRQQGRHQLADFEPSQISDNKVQILMTMWTDIRTHQDLWSEFYKGRLEGILELMGRKGTVKLVREFANGGTYTYTVEWE